MGMFSNKGNSVPVQTIDGHSEEKDAIRDTSQRHGEIEAQAQTGVQIDPEMERRVRRKLDWHIIPLVSALYLLAFLDRSNIG